MTKEFIRTTFFEKQWNGLNLTDENLRELENHMMKNPGAGDIIKGTGGAMKLRWASQESDKGKRGGVRVIYVDMTHKSRIYLLICYPKAGKDDLSHEEKGRLKKLISMIKGE